MAGELSRTAISAAVDGLGWRYLLGLVRTAVPVPSLAAAADAAAKVTAVAGDDADGHVWLDVRADRLQRAVAQPPGRFLDRRAHLLEPVRGPPLLFGQEPLPACPQFTADLGHGFRRLLFHRGRPGPG